MSWNYSKGLYFLLSNVISYLMSENIGKLPCYTKLILCITLRKECPYSELLRISPYSVRMQENADQNNSKYGHFLRSVSNH